MENEFGNANPSNGTQQTYDDMDADTLKTFVLERDKKLQEIEGKNKQLFERAKTAEGFEKQEDGSWVKKEKTKPKAEKPDDKLLEKLDRLTLKASSISEQDEIDMALRWKERTGLDLDEILSDDIFQAKLKDLRDKKSIEQATASAGKGGGGTNQAKNTPEYWIAKGVPPTAEQVPDRKARATIARAMMSASKSSKTFYND